jgi:hypothetical protein
LPTQHSDIRITWIVTLEDANKLKTTVAFGPYAGKAKNPPAAGGEE